MSKQFQISHRIYSYLLLALVLISSVLIVKIEQRSILFLIGLVAIMALCLRYRKLFDSGSVFIARTLLGLLFIFSGFVKGVDPLGTQYIIHDYLEAYQMPFLLNLALPASFFLNMLEFCIGVLLLFNVKIKFTAIITALMMFFFTIVTWYDAVASPVPDCGCFGKALILTNWQTFYKNLVLDSLVIILFFSASRIRYRFPSKIEYSIIAASVIIFLGFEYYNYRNLPVIDFLDWKEGKRMLVENPEPIKYYVTYKNKTTGEEKEYLLSECPYNDITWAKEWEFVSRRDEDPNPKTTQISILSRSIDENGAVTEETEITKQLLGNSDYQFFVIAYDLAKTDRKALAKIIELQKQAEEQGYYMYYLTASTPEEAAILKKELNAPDMEFYYADDTSLKGMIRANPGLMLLKNSVVLKHWSSRDIPTFDAIDLEDLEKKHNAN